jgi:glyoxylase-like metal-dependent hydrolase (beta-lactamase superfamily II)
MLRPRDVATGIQSFAARTPTLPPATHTNSYALGERDVLLVEPATPYEDERREWLEWARSLDAQGRRPVAIFLTHHHGDHVGGAEFFRRELRLPLWSHEATASRLPEVSVARRLGDGEQIALEGPTPQRWRVLHTPGHAWGHLCLFEPDAGALLAGDMVATVGTILIEPEDGDMTEYIAQLERLRALGSRVVLPAHGAPIEDPEALFDRYVRHRRMREAKVLRALLARGPDGGTAEDLVPRAYDDTPEPLFGLALLSLRAHLAKLVREGLASRNGERYVATGAS